MRVLILVNKKIKPQGTNISKSFKVVTHYLNVKGVIGN